MKKFIAILAVLMLVPFTAFGLESLSEDVMDNVTGQAGVSIAADITVNLTMDTMAWGDSDGIDADTSDSAGWIGLKNFNMSNLRIRLDSSLAAQGVTGIAQIKLFTIDVATGTKNGVANTTFVRLGLGSQHITMDSMTAAVQLGGAHGLGQEMGDFAIIGFDMILDGNSTVDIYAHGGAGVTMDLNVMMKTINIAAMSWGDKDGLGTDTIINPLAADGPLQVSGDNTNAGYVGLANLAIVNMSIKGQVMIDVASLDRPAIGTNGAAQAGLLYVYNAMLATGYDGGTTGVLIRLNNLAIHMDSFAADVVLAGNSALTTGASTLGNIWMDNMNMTVNGWVGIFAH